MENMQWIYVVLLVDRILNDEILSFRAELHPQYLQIAIRHFFFLTKNDV